MEEHPVDPTPVTPEPPPSAERPVEREGEGPVLTCGNCRQASPAGLVECPACGGGLRTGTAALLAVVAGLSGLAALAYYGYEVGTTRASILRPAFFSVMGLLGVVGAWSVWNGRRAGWIGLHLIWIAQVLVPLAYAILLKREVVQTLVRDPRDFLIVKLPILVGLAVAWLPATRAFCSAPSNLMTLFRRELESFLYYPLAYVILTAFLLMMGLFFYLFVRSLPDFYLETGLERVFGSILTFLIFCAPILTMRLVSEEKKSGTIEVLMTAPVTETQVVLAKFFSVLAYFGILLVPTFVYVVMICRYSLATPDYGLIVGGYVAQFFMASASFSLGLFISSLTRHQVVAAIITFVCFVALWIVPGFIEEGVASGWVRTVFEHINFVKYHDVFMKGIIDSRAIVFDLSLTALFLFLTVRVLESRRWA
jgi:ABC-2 type transport system permease protein